MAQTKVRSYPGQFHSEEQEVRVEDYLNDKLQTAADLESLDSLLENVQNQHSLFKQQVL